MYIVESKKGYISEFTFIFDKVCLFMKNAYYFDDKTLRKFFIFRDKKRYKIYQIGEERSNNKW